MVLIPLHLPSLFSLAHNVLAGRPWRLSIAAAENATEMRHVAETPLIGYLSDGEMGQQRIAERRHTKLQALLEDISGQGLAGVLHKGMHMAGRQTKGSSDGGNTQVGIWQIGADVIEQPGPVLIKDPQRRPFCTEKHETHQFEQSGRLIGEFFGQDFVTPLPNIQHEIPQYAAAAEIGATRRYASWPQITVATLKNGSGYGDHQTMKIFRLGGCVGRVSIHQGQHLRIGDSQTTELAVAQDPALHQKQAMYWRCVSISSSGMPVHSDRRRDRKLVEVHITHGSGGPSDMKVFRFRFCEADTRKKLGRDRAPVGKIRADFHRTCVLQSRIKKTIPIAIVPRHS